MSELALSIPPVVLTPYAFLCAQEAGIGNISADIQGMREVIGITEAAHLRLPSLTTTVLRVHRLTDRDQIFKEAPDDFLYTPAQDLPEEGRSMRQISAASLRSRVRSQGGAIVELTVKNWKQDELPEYLAEQLAFQIEELKVQLQDPGLEQGLSYAIDALGALASWGLRLPELASPRYQRQQAARSARPYVISHHPDKHIY